MPATVGYAVERITKEHAAAADKMFEELEIGREFRRSRENIWRQSERQYGGRMWQTMPDDTTSDLININISFSTVNTILPHLTGMEPEYSVIPFSKDATSKNARIQEAFLNRMWRHKPVGAQIGLKRAVFDYIVLGDGYMKTTWQIVTRSTAPDESSEVAEIFVDRVSPWDVWIDPNSEGIDKARWVAIRIWTTETEARDDTTLTIPKDFEFTIIDPTSDTDSDVGDRPYHATSIARKWVVLYEMYDIVNETLYVVPKDGDKTPWKVVEGITIPIEQIPGYTIAQSPYHMGDLEQIRDIQLELDKTRSQQLSHRKRNVAKVFIKEDALSSDAKDALRSSIVGEMIPIKGEGLLDDLVKPMQLAPLPAESYSAGSQAKEDINDITGISDYQRGSGPDITRTATEAQIIQGSSNVKIDAKLSDVEHALRNVGEYILGIARDVYPMTDIDEMAMFIGGVDGRAINQLQAGEDIQAAVAEGDEDAADTIASSAGLFGETVITPGEEIFVGSYEVIVQHSSTDAMAPKVKADKYRAITMMLSELMPVLQQAGVQIDMGRVVRLWLEAEKIPGVEAILSGGGQPQDPALGGGQGALPAGVGEVPPDLASILGGGGAPGAPEAPITADNSGALDPNAYPLVGQ